MEDYAKSTCIQFVPKTNADTNYVYIIPDQGCYSMVGKTGECPVFVNGSVKWLHSGGRQTVSLGSGCVQKGIIIHELMVGLCLCTDLKSSKCFVYSTRLGSSTNSLAPTGMYLFL